MNIKFEKDDIYDALERRGGPYFKTTERILFEKIFNYTVLLQHNYEMLLLQDFRFLCGSSDDLRPAIEIDLKAFIGPKEKLEYKDTKEFSIIIDSKVFDCLGFLGMPREGKNAVIKNFLFICPWLSHILQLLVTEKLIVFVP